jgi:hypothetical protein
MTCMQITSEMLDAGLLVLGLSMLWVRCKPDRNRVTRAVYWIYQKTTFATSVGTDLLMSGIVLIVLGAALLLGVVR